MERYRPIQASCPALGAQSLSVMSSVSLRDIAQSRARRTFWRRVWRNMLVAFGCGLIVIGVPFTLLPGHLGLLPLVVGLVIVLRTSRPARRRFIGLQRRHPRLIFPIRRLLRRESEVFPVAWQQILRAERFILPRRWRVARALRRGFFWRRRRSAR